MREVRRYGVLKAEDNEILTRVGPRDADGRTACARYWTPACLSEEIPAPGSPPRPGPAAR